MKLFITGVTSVLGQQTANLLLKQNHELHGLIRSKNKANLIKDIGINPIIGNLNDKDFMLESTKGFDGFLNLASSVPKKFNTKGKDWTEFVQLRTDTIKILAKVIHANKIPLYIQPTSLLGYGHRGDRYIDESIRLTFPIKPYFTDLNQEFINVLESSIKCEYILSHLFENTLPRIVLRFGLLYGPDMFHTNELIEQVQKNVFPIIDEGEGILNLLHVHDAASAIVQTVANHENLMGRTFNVSDDEPVTYAKLVTSLAKKLSAKEPKKVPIKLGNTLIGKFEANILLSSVKNNNEKFKKMAPWKPRYPSFREGFDAILKNE